ncbi:surface antigen [Weissella uvarum]|uniref:COG3942 and LysM peptidoglycan-binding domain-containing protein n=1 Tax=Weissella uvarum TaxID=1479233 RepID=UPI0019605A7F|nr:CHAP domain-containing protein [Weissella uvarum]MBM7616659.1 surface antigen [Weissella uvarum]MCM0594883.1 CHAP domain-containing protein [Weissella uvarum]
MNTTAKNTLLATAGAVAAFGGATAVASADSVTVKSGDTLYSIAKANDVSVSELAKINKVTNPDLIFVGQELKVSKSASAAKPASQNTAATAQATTTTASTQTTSHAVTDASNTYPAGQCTWFVKNALPWVGNNWGNAVNWPASAAAAGFKVDGTPAAGSVVVFSHGAGINPAYGHVAVVDSVNPDGTIKISEGNYAGLAYHTRTISAAGLTFIH